MNQLLLWYLVAGTLAPYLDVRFIPLRQFCLPEVAHLELLLFRAALPPTGV